MVLSLLATLFLTACGVGEAQDPQSQPPAPEVTVAEVEVERLSDWADFTGRLEPVERVDVRPRVAGFVETVHFSEGSRVEAGDLLFRIDPRPFRAEVDRLEAERDRAEAERSLADAYRERAERLLAQNATSKEEFEQLNADASVAEARLAAVKAALASAELDLSFTRVTAPISGRVSRAFVTAGNLVDSATLLTTVVSDDPVYAYFDIDEQTYLELVQGRAHGGASVYLGLIDEQGYPHSATLDFVDNTVDPTQGSIRARAVIDNASGRFTAGLFARLKLVSPESFTAALVDDRAVGTDLGRKFVYVLDDNDVVEYRSIETGRLVDGLRVVTSGLEPRDRVIVNGLQRVRPGVTVAPTRVAMDRDAPSLHRFRHHDGRSGESKLRLADRVD
jgi:RND family efflux transporter MFP subunit